MYLFIFAPFHWRPRFGAVLVWHAEIFPLKIVNIFVWFVNISDWIVNLYLFKFEHFHWRPRFGAVLVRHADIFPRMIVNLFLQAANIFHKNLNVCFLKFAASHQHFRFGALRVWHAEIFPLNVFVCFVNIFDKIVNVYLFKCAPAAQVWCGESSFFLRRYLFELQIFLIKL